MVSRSSEVRHVVAWLPAVRWATCVALWAMLAVVWLLPHATLSLRTIAPLGLAAAMCRTSVAVALHYGRTGPVLLFGGSLAADAALLRGPTGLAAVPAA